MQSLLLFFDLYFTCVSSFFFSSIYISCFFFLLFFDLYFAFLLSSFLRFIFHLCYFSYKFQDNWSDTSSRTIGPIQVPGQLVRYKFQDNWSDTIPSPPNQFLSLCTPSRRLAWNFKTKNILDVQLTSCSGLLVVKYL